MLKQILTSRSFPWSRRFGNLPSRPRRCRLGRSARPRSIARLAGSEQLEQRRLLVATVSVVAETPTAVPESSTNPLIFTFTRDDDVSIDDFLAVKFEITGDAQFGVDYDADETRSNTIWFPENPLSQDPLIATANFLPGEDTLQMIARPRADSEFELNEDIQVTILGIETFGSVNGASALIQRGEETVYYLVDDSNQLATVDHVTGCVHVIGTLDIADPITDIAFTEDGDLYAISTTNLYLLKPQQAASGIVPTQFINQHFVIGANALVAAQDEDFGSGDGDLFAVGAAFLGIQWIDLEVIDDAVQINNVQTVFNVDAALESLLITDDYFATGDLEYTSRGDLIMSATTVEHQYDSLIRIETPGESGLVDTAPKPAEDPDELFDNLFGLAFDGSDSFAFSGHTMLRVNQLSLDSTRHVEMTGVDYLIGDNNSATGVILGDPVDPPTVSLNPFLIDPPDRNGVDQPTSWAVQRAEFSDIRIELGAPPVINPLSGIELTNLGVNGNEIPQIIELTSANIVFDPGSEIVLIQPTPGQMTDGRYELRLSTELTFNEEFVFVGDSSNRFHLLDGDWDGNGRVDILDFEAFAYWFDTSTPVAPQYMDLDGSGTVDGDDFTVFQANYGSFVNLPGVGNPIDPALVDPELLSKSFQTAINRLDVNGSGAVSPLDALNVINRLAAGMPRVTDWRFDTNFDGSITPRDALLVINALARQSAAGGEQIVVPSHSLNWLPENQSKDDDWQTQVDMWFASVGSLTASNV